MKQWYTAAPCILPGASFSTLQTKQSSTYSQTCHGPHHSNGVDHDSIDPYCHNRHCKGDKMSCHLLVLCRATHIHLTWPQKAALAGSTTRALYNFGTSSIHGHTAAVCCASPTLQPLLDAGASWSGHPPALTGRCRCSVKAAASTCHPAVHQNIIIAHWHC